MTNKLWLFVGFCYSTPIKRIVLCNGTAHEAKSLARRKYGFTKITSYRELGKEKDPE